MDDNVKELLCQGFEDPETRRQYAAGLLHAHIALQIKTLRQQRGWSQTKLAKLAGKHQSQISDMESIDFSSWKISTLMKLAEAFDLALTVSFESFGTFLDEAASLGRDALERPSFADDPAFHDPASRAALTQPSLAESPESPAIVADFLEHKARRSEKSVSRDAQIGALPEQSFFGDARSRPILVIKANS